MTDETDKTSEAEAAPNRGRRREAPTIEASAIPEAKPAETPVSEPPAGETPIAAAPAAREPAPERASFASALPGVAALLLSGVALYYALNPATPEAPPGPSPEAVAALGQRLDRVESRLGALESKPAPTLPAMPDLAPLTARIDAAQKAADAARADAGRALQQAQNPPKPPEAPRVDLAPIEQRIARLEGDLRPLREALTAPKSEVRATESPDVQGVSPNDAAALAVVAGSLRQQLDRGAPYPREMSALEKLGADPAALGKLKAFAADGAPSAARLAQDFAAVSPAMLRAARPASAGGDIMDRLARAASGLVRVSPVGETAGEDAPALVGRIDAALQRGDVGQALALYDRLPDAARDPARDWASRARQRAEADAAARGLLDAALDKLARK